MHDWKDRNSSLFPEVKWQKPWLGGSAQDMCLVHMLTPLGLRSGRRFPAGVLDIFPDFLACILSLPE